MIADGFSPLVRERMRVAAQYLRTIQQPDYAATADMLESARTEPYEAWVNRAQRMGTEESTRFGRETNLRSRAADALREAASLYCRTHPEDSDFEARRQVIHRFNRDYLDVAPFYLEKDFTIEDTPTLARLKDEETLLPACPLSPTYRHLFHFGHAYWQDSTYQKLTEMADDELPEGAIRSLLSLLPVSTQLLSHAGEPGVDVRDVLKRYSTRLFPCLVDLLRQPTAYGYPATCKSWPPWFPRDLVLALPGPQACTLFRAGLEAGWTSIAADLPECPWSETLLSEFADSPYGPPASPPWKTT